MSFSVYLLAMALTTYLIRMIPFTVFRGKIKSRFLQDFLYYIPYAVLSAMTFPAIFYATENTAASIVGCMVALVLAFFEKSLLTASICACAAAFLVIWLG